MASGQSKFRRFDLPLHVSVEVPHNWWLLSGDLNTSIETAGEAVTKLAGLELPAGRKVNLLRANSMPRSTYAAIAVNANDPDIPPAVVESATTEELKGLEQMMASGMRSGLAAQNLTFIESLGLWMELTADIRTSRYHLRLSPEWSEWPGHGFDDPIVRWSQRDKFQYFLSRS